MCVYCVWGETLALLVRWTFITQITVFPQSRDELREAIDADTNQRVRLGMWKFPEHSNIMTGHTKAELKKIIEVSMDCLTIRNMAEVTCSIN